MRRLLFLLLLFPFSVNALTVAPFLVAETDHVETGDLARAAVSTKVASLRSSGHCQGYYYCADYTFKIHGNSYSGLFYGKISIKRFVRSSCTAPEEWNDEKRYCVLPCDPPNYLNESAQQCLPPKKPEECKETGQAFDPEIQQCAEECPGGMLNGICLSEPDPDPDGNECNSESDDYLGNISQGYGKSPVSVCGSGNECSGGGTIGIFNGELKCLSEDYGPPKCSNGSVGVVDRYGSTCQPLEDTPNPGDGGQDGQGGNDEEEPNKDTDGDGEPDEYDKDNDPNINRKQLDELKKLQESIDQTLANLENLTGGGNSRLDEINSAISELLNMAKNGELNSGGGGSPGSGGGDGDGDGGGDGDGNGDGENPAEEGPDYSADIAKIKNNTKDTADALKKPEGGLNTEAIGTAPEFSESVTALKTAFFGNSTVELVSTIPTIAKSTSCPTWTFPQTQFWGAQTMDIHCSIIEQYRGQLSAMFMFFWTIVAIFIFLRA